MFDYHLHTTYSPDGKMTIDEACTTALRMGLKYIAITDHIDFFPDDPTGEWILSDIPGYMNAIEQAKSIYRDLDIARGLEVGYTPESFGTAAKMVMATNPDFVIGSAHLINGFDPYWPLYFENKTKDEAYREYLLYLYNGIRPLSSICHVIGHLDYVVRRAPYEDTKMRHIDYQNILDDVLNSIISLGMGIEINTYGYRTGPEPMPNYSIISRYRQLGGEILTIGSDAHDTSHVGHGISDAVMLAKEAGFRFITVFHQGKPEFLPI